MPSRAEHKLKIRFEMEYHERESTYLAEDETLNLLNTYRKNLKKNMLSVHVHFPSPECNDVPYLRSFAGAWTGAAKGDGDWEEGELSAKCEFSSSFFLATCSSCCSSTPPQPPIYRKVRVSCSQQMVTPFKPHSLCRQGLI